MRARSVPLALAALALSGSLCLAEPEVRISYPGGVPHVAIAGDYARSRYTVWRATGPGGPFLAITERNVLCLGPCYASDPSAEPGRAYYYRFDLALADGSWVSFGPYRVVISPELARPIGASVHPNPGRGPARVELYVAGAAGLGSVAGEAAIYDLQGRRVSVLHAGALARGMTTLAWDGRGDGGDELAAGVYLLRFTAAGHARAIRLVRLR